MKKRRRRRRRAGFRKLPVFLLMAVLAAAAALGIHQIMRGECGPGSDAGSAVLMGAGGRIEEAVRDTEERQETQQKLQEPAEEMTGAEQTAQDLGADSSGKYVSDPEAAPKLRIVLDPGHGGPGITDEQELGAIYRNTYEKYLTLEIARALGEELSQYGNVEIFYTRESDTALTLKERAAYAASVDADVLISLHLNASREHNLFGSEVFVSAYGEKYAYGSGLGSRILSELVDYGFASKGVKTRLGSHGDYYGIIRECGSLGIPAIIVEHGYMDEDRDWGRMDSEEELQELGRRDAAGIAAYFGLEKGRTLAELMEPELELPEISPVQPDITPPEDVWYTLSRVSENSAEITLYAEEPESSLMYYDYSLDGGETWQSAQEWTEEGPVTFAAEISASQESDLIVRAYNTYELRTEAERR